MTNFGLLYLIFFLVCLVKIALMLRSLALLTVFVCFSARITWCWGVTTASISPFRREKHNSSGKIIFIPIFFSNFASIEFTYKLNISIVKQLNCSVILPHAACRRNCRRIPWGTSSPGLRIIHLNISAVKCPYFLVSQVIERVCKPSCIWHLQC